jgi:mRNA interferase HigB
MYNVFVRVISKRKLREFWENPLYRDSEGPLKAWHDEVEGRTWANFADVRSFYRSADAVGHNRIVFNIAGNKYRLVVHVHYAAQIVYIRFVGTHKQYDDIDVTTI